MCIPYKFILIFAIVVPFLCQGQWVEATKSNNMEKENIKSHKSTSSLNSQPEIGEEFLDFWDFDSKAKNSSFVDAFGKKKSFNKSLSEKVQDSLKPQQNTHYEMKFEKQREEKVYELIKEAERLLEQIQLNQDSTISNSEHKKTYLLQEVINEEEETVEEEEETETPLPENRAKLIGILDTV